MEKTLSKMLILTANAKDGSKLAWLGSVWLIATVVLFGLRH